VLLVAAAAAVSIVVFMIMHNAEKEQFESQYAGAAEKLLDAFKDIADQKLGAISSVGVATIAHGVDHFRDWPLVTLSSFQQRSSTARSLSKALFVSLNPLVPEVSRSEWEEYVVSEDAYWIEQGFEYQEDIGLDVFEPDWEENRRLQFGAEPGSSPIYYRGTNGTKITDPGPGPYLVRCFAALPFLFGCSLRF